MSLNILNAKDISRKEMLATEVLNLIKSAQVISHILGDGDRECV
jgi:hypothetical protein